MASVSLASSSHMARSMLPLFLRHRWLKIRTVVNIEENKEKIDLKPRSVSVRVAYELFQAGHRYLDVRTSDEFNAGHPHEAINIPYYLKIGGEGMVKNSKFLEEVSSEFGKKNKIIVGCKSGRRSLMAATDLQAAVSYSFWKFHYSLHDPVTSFPDEGIFDIASPIAK
ncbi:hypothetical protein PTKIN_Ptkin09bG0099400 [Pterospermum kingtungense]